MAVRPSSRQSVAAGSLSRKSMAPGSLSLGHASAAVIQYDENGNVLLSAAQQRVKDKQRESEGFTKLKRQTEQQQQYVDSLTDKTNLLAEGSDVISKVVSNWQNVFRATHIALASLAARESQGDVQTEGAQLSTLIRIPTAARKAQDEGNAT